ncbi:MAG: M1 family metallopeptidase, partial [bacterium]
MHRESRHERLLVRDDNVALRRSFTLLRATVLVALATLSAVASVRAQARELSVADSSPFRPLALPTPNEMRNGAGRPGPRYWQQRADYRIAATLDSARNELRGRETIHYVNNSLDALPYLWLQVEQNICAPTSITSILNQPPLVFGETAFDFSCGNFTGKPTMESAKVNGVDAKRTGYGTMMRIDLPTPLAPKSSVDLEFVWHFTVPEQGAGRMGRDGALYEIAQWYPRMAVYDDVRGWNHEPYIGAGEFYLEYGSFDVTLTVPASYIVAATGELRNADQVLTTTQRSRLAAAHHSDTAVAIITRDEAGKPAQTRPGTHAFTWHFSANNVRDFAWAAAPNWQWEASNLDGILIETLYRSAADKWTEAHRMARGAVKHFSEQWYRYPYSHATTVEGPVGGMEYPMLTF